LLFGVQSWDPLSHAVAVVVLGAVGSLAAWIPARRAVTIDPQEALRAE
jgi:ABC-type lipoprotein release transport system permease subunit